LRKRPYLIAIASILKWLNCFTVVDVGVFDNVRLGIVPASVNYILNK
jgi:hypothetical protein